MKLQATENVENETTRDRKCRYAPQNTVSVKLVIEPKAMYINSEVEHLPSYTGPRFDPYCYKKKEKTKIQQIKLKASLKKVIKSRNQKINSQKKINKTKN